MPVPDLSSFNKRLSDVMREWLPKVADPETFNSTPVGQASGAANLVMQPGLGVAAYALGKLRSTGPGKNMLGAMEAVPPVGAELKLASKVHNFPGPSMVAAAPAGFLPWLWKSAKNEKGVEHMPNWEALSKGLEKYAATVFRVSKLGGRKEDLVEQGVSAVVEQVDNPKIPSGMTNEQTLEWLINNTGKPAIAKIGNVDRKHIDNIIEGKEGGAVDRIQELPSQAISAEQSMINSQQTADPKRAAEIKLAESVHERIMSPRMRAIIDSIGANMSGPEIREKVKVETGEDISKQLLQYYKHKNADKTGATLNPAVRENLINPLVRNITEGAEVQSTEDLSKSLVSQGKLLKGINVDATIDTLKSKGVDPALIPTIRRYLNGANPSRITDGFKPEAKRKTLLDLNSAIEQLFTVYKKEGK